jgi:hypothetical protein
MAAKKATRLDPAFAADVAGVQTALAAWRKRRKPREPIPETLWHDIIRMAQIYQTSPVAQALRVNYTALATRFFFRRRLFYPAWRLLRGVEA